jgi:hypothetical protein
LIQNIVTIYFTSELLLTYQIWTFGETNPSAIEKGLARKDIITTGCGQSPINPALSNARCYLKKALTRCIRYMHINTYNYEVTIDENNVKY